MVRVGLLEASQDRHVADFAGGCARALGITRQPPFVRAPSGLAAAGVGTLFSITQHDAARCIVSELAAAIASEEIMSRLYGITAVRVAIASAFLLGTAGMGMNHLLRRGRSHAVHGYAPSLAIARIVFHGSRVPAAVTVRDFDVSGGEAFLLDPVTPRIFVMHETSGGWTVARSFGRRGGGPGELLHPSGIAVSGDRVFIVDRDRLHLFDRRGRYIGSGAPVLPCPLLEPHVYTMVRRILLTGRCMRGDTVTAEIFYTSAGDSASSIAHDPIFTGDGKTGSLLGAETLYSPGETHGLFGGGTGDCVYRISLDTAEIPRAAPVCGLAAVRYAFEPSRAYRAKVRRLSRTHPFMTAALTMPGDLPTYVDRLVTESGDFILRPYSNDSLAFRRMGSREDVMIGPTFGFIGCRSAGCLWVRQDSVPLMMFVPARTISAAGAIKTAARS